MNKLVRVEIPGVQRTRYRWIVRKRDDGRYIVRAPKIGVAVKDLSLLRESDWGKETLLPLGSKILSIQTLRK
jgi:ribosomal protein S28E/S33